MAAPAVGPRTATVLDVAYGRLETSAGTGLRIGALVSAIDAGSVVVGGRRRHPRDAWASAVAEAIGPQRPSSVTVAHPSTWGSRRVGVVISAVEAVLGDGGPPITAQPRAVLLAATHLEASVQACALLETHDDRVDVHRLHRTADGWRIGRTSVLDADCTPDDLADLIDDAVEVVLVDGDRADRVDAVLDLVADATPTGRVAAVDRALLHRFGVPRESRSAAPGTPVPAPTGRGRVLTAAGVLLVVVAVIVGIVVWRGADDDPAPRPSGETAQIGRVSLTVPRGLAADLRRTRRDGGGRVHQHRRTGRRPPDPGRRELGPRRLDAGLGRHQPAQPPLAARCRLGRGVLRRHHLRRTSGRQLPGDARLGRAHPLVCRRRVGAAGERRVPTGIAR